MSNFKPFKAGSLFEIISNPQLNKESFRFTDKGYPYFTRTAFNNGILGYVEYLDEEHKIKGNSLAIGMIEMRFHYMESDFYAGQFTKTAFPKFEGFNKRLALYFTALFGKYQSIYQGVLIRDFEKLFYDTEISLPVTTSGEIDFAYMENYIRELEATRIRELEAYLRVTGLTDYKLSDNDIQFISYYYAGGAKYKRFRLGDLFDIQTPKKKFNANTIKFGGKHRYVARGESNNGIRGNIDEDIKYLNSANTISFGQDTSTMFYQNAPYFTGDKIKIFTLKNHELTREIANFLIASMKKAFVNFGWGKSSFNVNILNEVVVSLPADQDGNPDYDYMTHFIRIQQKLAIKNVVEWKDKELAVYKKVTSS